MTKLTENQISERLISLNGWFLKDGSIKKVFKTKGFPQTMGLVAEIGALCQQFDHHPDYLTLKYSEVEVSFSTHSIGGLSEKDFEIAKQIELL
ncbi:MAG: 4a-hydroxytetrahydrobiopterin dehydratase [Ignavibacteriae bacterium]|nr:4a-hydroxytetrahydrobiopterin dehydratase [Ignavibacteriota bacterium]